MSFWRRILSKQPDEIPSSGRSHRNALVIKEMRRAGADLRKWTEVRHYLYFATREHAQEVADKLRAEDFQLSVEPSASGDGKWLALATHFIVVNQEVIDSVTARLSGLTAAYDGGEYDGWEAAITS
ncbi:MAG: ribonuclease E inhibitor RraB [Actinomycetota bacterium]